MGASVPGEHPGCNSKEAGPVVILTAARSGSTLLRFILDAHPDLACPPESGLGTACSAMARVRSVLESTSRHDGESQREDAPVDLVDPSAAAAIRHALDGYYSDYLRRRGKIRWCEKSLDNFMFAGLIGQVFPGARFICLYRHCMDVIASGVETSPWGLRGFGFSDFAHQFPGNSVAAITGYWMNVARIMLAFEKENPERCLRIRYEDMVTDPESIAASVFSFIGAAQVPGITEACFSANHDRRGPADQKIWFTNRISTASVGRGITVPVTGVPTPAIDPLNQILAELGYRMVGEDWNLAVGYVDPRAEFLVPGVDQPSPTADDAAAAVRDEVLALLNSRLADGMSKVGASPDSWPSLHGKHVHLVVENGACPPAEMTWAFGSGPVIVPRPDQQHHDDASGGLCGLIVGPAAVWWEVLAGEANMATEILAGRLRCASSVSRTVGISQEAYALAELLGLASPPPRQMPERAAGRLPETDLGGAADAGNLAATRAPAEIV
jgi:hypothetical protein